MSKNYKIKNLIIGCQVVENFGKDEDLIIETDTVISFDFKFNGRKYRLHNLIKAIEELK